MAAGGGPNAAFLHWLVRLHSEIEHHGLTRNKTILLVRLLS